MRITLTQIAHPARNLLFKLQNATPWDKIPRFLISYHNIHNLKGKSGFLIPKSMNVWRRICLLWNVKITTYCRNTTRISLLHWEDLFYNFYGVESGKLGDSISNQARMKHKKLDRDTSDESKPVETTFRVFEMGRWKVSFTIQMIETLDRCVLGGQVVCHLWKTIHLEEEMGEMLEWGADMQWQVQTWEKEEETRRVKSAVILPIIFCILLQYMHPETKWMSF